MGAKRRAKKPEIVEVSGVRVKIYRAVRKVGGKPYPYFRVRYHEPGHGRRTRDFATLEDAIREAKSAAGKIASGRNDAITLTREDVSELHLCRSKLEGTGATLFEAVDFFMAHRGRNQIVSRPTPEVVAEYLSDLEARNASEAYLDHEKHAGGRFAAAFPQALDLVTPLRFRGWLGSVRLRGGGVPSKRYLRNLHRAFVAIINFATRRRYVSRERAAEFAEIEAPMAEAPRCEVFTVEEFRKLLLASDDDTRPAIVLSGFCGLRTAEVGRLEWSDVNLPERVVTVGAHVAKTQSRRVVPLCDAAMAWLAPYAGRTGPVLDVDPREISAVGVRAGVPWRKNGLRHGFASCRLAVLKNAPEVAFEMGNSPAMIQKHYRSLVTEAQGKAWFDIRPAQASNVVPMPASA